MIKFKSMSWANALSYGENNSINFTNPLVQLVGKNGSGKSSIALILEEVLYNKNSKGIKKVNILNRNTKAKNYTITLEFVKDADEYLVKTVRGSTQTVQLLKNGEDISSHTSTNTYKMIENIIGMDHKTFSQIVYQSDPFSLEFLTSSDSVRKKFLVDLLRLDRYTEIYDKIKSDIKDIQNKVEVLNSSKKHIESWLASISENSLKPKELLIAPNMPTSIIEEVGVLKNTLNNITSINKKIATNNQYKNILNSIDITNVIEAPNTEAKDELNIEVRKLEARIKELKGTILQGTNIPDICSKCGQPIDNNHKKALVKEAQEELAVVEAKLLLDRKALAEENLVWSKFIAYQNNVSEFEKYVHLVDKTLPTELLDENDVKKHISKLETQIKSAQAEIDNIVKTNKEIAAHNSKAAGLREVKSKMEADLKPILEDLYIYEVKLSSLQILLKAFSSTGFIAYKIESLVKDLEAIVNKYLADMSGGRFQLAFVLGASDKLDVVVTDNGDTIDIQALSRGELAKVSISTLLAIRSLMQSVSNVRCNLLILDETIESIDLESKEKLLEILLAEEHLNTILVSHGFSHPLIQKLEVIKENDVSRIE